MRKYVNEERNYRVEDWQLCLEPLLDIVVVVLVVYSSDRN